MLTSFWIFVYEYFVSKESISMQMNQNITKIHLQKYYHI